MGRTAAIWLMLSAMSANLCAAAPSAPAFKLETLAENLDRPWGMTQLPDESLLISERSGQLRRWHQGKLSAPIVGLPKVLDVGQGGLLDVLAAADFKSSGKLWISYSAGSVEANHTAVSELTLDLQSTPPVVISARLLFAASPDKSGSAHFGGRLLEREQTLLLTLGDGFDFREAAQDQGSHLGKIIAIDLTGKTVGNPAGKTAAQIFSSGHRNVQGLIWDAEHQRIWQHEHGPQGGDELNLLIQGGNYGWPAISTGLDYTGAVISPFASHSRFVSPAHTWTPSIAPSGMLLYTGAMFPKWQGNLMVAALAGKALHRLVLSGEKVSLEEVLLVQEKTRWRDIEQAADGSIYLLSDGDEAKLMRLTNFSSP